MEMVLGTIFKWIAIYMGMGLMFVIGSMAPTVNSGPNRINKWKIFVAWLPALFVSKVKRWVNDRKVEEEIKMKTIPNEIQIEELYLSAGESITVCLNRQRNHTVVLRMQVFPEGGCELIIDDKRKKWKKLSWPDP